MLSAAATVRFFQKDGEGIRYPAGTEIFRQGEIGELMYGILEGEVDLVVDGTVVETLQQDDIFGEGALVQASQMRASTAIARTDCVLASLDRRRFLFAVQETPMFALEVMQSFSSRLRRLKQKQQAQS